MKHRIVHTLQKYLLNPPIKLALAMGLPLPGYALLETKGRKTGKPRRTPVGDGRLGNQFWPVAEHGMNAGYVRNIQRNSRVGLKLREGLTFKFGFQVFGGNGAFHSDLLRKTLKFDARIGLPDSCSKFLPKFSSRFGAVGVPETRFGNRLHTVAAAKTKGCAQALRRATDCQQRCHFGCD